MELVRFFAFIVKVAICLALVGELKSCTLELMGKAANTTERGIMSYSKFTRMLTH